MKAAGGLAITTGEGVVPGVRLWHLGKWVLSMKTIIMEITNKQTKL